MPLAVAIRFKGWEGRTNLRPLDARNLNHRAIHRARRYCQARLDRRHQDSPRHRLDSLLVQFPDR
jgi:hypothetical protein